MNKIYLGCNPSILDGTEQTFITTKSLKIPQEYSFQTQLSPILNQGNTNMCVTYAISTYIDWNINMSKMTKCRDNNVDRKSIYSARTKLGDNGMTIKEALNYIKTIGVKTNVGLSKIKHFAKIGSIDSLKQALIANGPCIGGLMCYGDYIDFWNKKSNKPMGGHAISIIGFNKQGFIIRNSWGMNYGNDGYALIKYSDFDKFFEIWTIID